MSRIALTSGVFLLAAGILCNATEAATPTVDTAHYSDVHYRCTLDLYLPDESCEPLPVVLFIHGGGWVVGDKADIGSMADELMNRGFAVASMNYRFSYDATFPAQVFDCKAAVRWLRAHAYEYNLDADRIGVYGESAGGYLATMLGTSEGVANLEGDTGNNAYSSAVQAVGDMYGPIDLAAMGEYDGNPTASESLLIGHSIPEINANQYDPSYATLVAMLDQTNPMNYINGNEPAFFIAHGTADTTVPMSQSQNLAAALHDAGIHRELTLVDSAGHGLPDETYDELFDFFEQELGDSQSQGLRHFNGKKADERFGQSVAFAGDVNRDGVEDVIIGAPYNDQGGTNAGRVYVYSGADGKLLKSLGGEHVGDLFGWSVAPAGDVNGDHYDDYLIGAPHNDAGGSNAGRVYLYSGKTHTKLLTLTGKNAGDQFGYSLAGGKDLTGDGTLDFAVGAPFADGAGSNSGRVYVFGWKSSKAIDSFNGQHGGDNFGKVVGIAGDVNDDGRADVIVGAPGNDAGGSSAGRAYVYGKVGSSFKRLITITGSNAGDKLGSAVCGAGDANGDGYDDVLIGAPGANGVGAAAVYSGMDGLKLVDLVAGELNDGQKFGSAVASTRGHIGIGGGRYMVSRAAINPCGFEVGAVDVYGSDGTLIESILGRNGEKRFGKSLCSGTDLDGDGFGDLLVGSHLANVQEGGTSDGTGRAVVISGLSY
ncbi:MAG TPA: alpha/beta hydrolase fold domain-containing protein [Phycisphaerales bacterium]|nr:alpha/beta hydrolase fold domain-containing protein [Phycisphaerales bacterium]